MATPHPDTPLTEEQMRALGATHYRKYSDGSVLYLRLHPLADKGRRWQTHFGRDCDEWVTTFIDPVLITAFDPPHGR